MCIKKEGVPLTIAQQITENVRSPKIIKFIEVPFVRYNEQDMGTDLGAPYLTILGLIRLKPSSKVKIKLMFFIVSTVNLHNLRRTATGSEQFYTHFIPRLSYI